MKKRWIPFIVVCMAVAFISGQFFGVNAQIGYQEARAETQAFMQTTIAVINADTGSVVDGERQNFSAAIIDTLGEDFVLVSPSMAYAGLSVGMYGAVITFPSHVSQRVLSFNTNNPEQVRLEFQINPNLPEQDFIETHTRIMDLQMAINTTMAYTYVSSIFEQFHAAQDQVDNIFQNDLSQMEALDIVNMEQFTASLQLDRLPDLPLTPNAPVTSHFMIGVTDFAEQVADMYSNSYDTAVEDYLEMRSDLIAMTEHFPEQENQWMETLEVWSDIFTQYGTDLQTYSSIVRSHQTDLEDWHTRTSFWNEDLMWYQENLDEWFDDISDWNKYLLKHDKDSFDWFISATNWSDDLAMYQLDLETWYLSASIWNDQLVMHDTIASDWLIEASLWHDKSAEHNSHVSDWKENLDVWNDDAKKRYDLTKDYLDDIEAFGIDVYNYLTDIVAGFDDAVAHLETWLDDFQLNDLSDLIDFAKGYNDYADEMQIVLDELNIWRDALESYTANVRLEINDLQVTIANLHPIPEINFFENDQAAQMQQYWLLVDWRDNAISTMDDVVQTTMDFGMFIPELDPGTPNLVSLNLPYWDENIPIPDILDIYLDVNDFIPPDIVPPEPKDAPPAFEGIQQPEIIDAPPELAADQPDEPPITDAKQPDEPPKITEPPPLSAIQPVIQQPGDPMKLETYQPQNPIAGRPPRPDDFWDSLDDMHRQLMRFDVDNYMTSANRWEVQRMLWDYERYMDTVRFDLASQFDDNVDMLLDIRFGYTDFLSELRTAAMQAEAETIDQLQSTLNVFSQRVENTSGDTRSRLLDFAGMMPESRTPIGPNHNLTRFTVAPFDIVTPQMRELTAAVEVEAESVAVVYEGYLWIALPALGVILALTLGSYGVPWFRKKEEE